MVSFLSFVTLALAGTVVASPLDFGMESKLAKRDGEVCSDASKKGTVSDAYSEAKALATGAINYIDIYGVTDDVYITYFGASQTPGVPEPLDFFSAVAKDTSVTLYCDPDSPCQPDSPGSILGAYNFDTDIYFCPSFYSQDDISVLCSGKTPDSGGNRGGTMLHELMRAVSNIGDFKDGCANARSLVLAFPEFASDNADNYSCFAMQVYVDTHCPS